MLRFTKMEGLGNDFVVIDGVRQRVSLRPESIRALADRHFGVGCDQVLLVEPADTPHTDFRYRIFNADGSEVEQCGNGARCFARFVRDQGLTDKDVIPVQTRAGRMELRILPDGRVTVDMGPPRLEPAEIPLDVPERRLRYTLELDGEPVEIGAVGMGNPHAIVLVEDVARAPVASLGPHLEIHPLFPKKTNVGFLEIVSRDRVRLRVWERGAGETLACGSNACAAVVAGRLWGRLDGRVTVSLPGGDLEISWDGLGNPVFMTGPARAVFEGVWLGAGLKEG